MKKLLPLDSLIQLEDKYAYLYECGNEVAAYYRVLPDDIKLIVKAIHELITIRVAIQEILRHEKAPACDHEGC